MVTKQNVITNLIQIYSLTVKDLKLHTRFKLEFVVEFIAPLFSVFFPLIIFNTLLSLDQNIFGSYYSKNNYLLFLLLGYCVSCLIFLLWTYQDLFYDEKTWKTLNAVFVAPVRKINILIGYFLSGLISKSFAIFFIVILCYIFYPIPLIFLLLSIILLFCISFTFAGMGFIIGVFEIVNEDISASLSVGINFIALVSCLFYPISIFPEEFHIFVKLNPLYYYFDLLRLMWWAGIDYSEAMKYITINHILFVAIFTIITPFFASYFFLRIYKIYGTTGY